MEHGAHSGWVAFFKPNCVCPGQPNALSGPVWAAFYIVNSWQWRGLFNAMSLSMFVSRLIGIARPDIVATISDLNQSQYKSFCDALKRSRFKSEFYILPRVLLIVAVSPQPGLILLDVLPPGQEEAGHQPMRGQYWDPLTNQRPV